MSLSIVIEQSVDRTRAATEKCAITKFELIANELKPFGQASSVCRRVCIESRQFTMSQDKNCVFCSIIASF